MITTIISTKGKNERMGKLFKTPKHNLLYKGRPALEQTVEYMSQFGDVKVMTHENSPPDTGIVDMLLQMELPDKFFVVDCDVIPIRLNKPQGTTAYLFHNKNTLEGYSNFTELNGKVISCNEKEHPMHWAGAGVYYFDQSKQFRDLANGCYTLAQVMQKMVEYNFLVIGDTTSEIFRFGSLNTILNNVHELGV